MRNKLLLLLFLVPVAILGQVPTPQALPGDTALFSFGIFADCQYCECSNSGTRFYKLSKIKLHNAVHRFNTLPLKFVVNLGDLINEGAASYDTLIPILKKLKHPLHTVYGNHDFLLNEEADKQVRQAWGLNKLYYSFSQPGWRFIVLNANDVGIAAYPEGSKEYAEGNAYIEQLRLNYAGNTNAYNGALGTQQMKWLRKELDEAARKNERVIVMGHMPIKPTGNGSNLWNDRELEVILLRYPQVAAYFCGHHHPGQYEESDGIHYLNFLGMVETSITAFSVIHIFGDRIEVQGFGREESRVLPLLRDLAPPVAE